MKNLTVGKLAKAAGVNSETVRFYERVGILPPPEKSASGYRVYTEQSVKRLQFVCRAKALGFSLEEIKGLLALYQKPDTDCEVICEQAQLKCKDIEQRIADLTRIKDALKKLEKDCPGGNKSLDECTITQCLNSELALPSSTNQRRRK